MSSAYVRENIDLSVPHDRFVIISTQGAKIATVYVIELPAPASIHFGGGDEWPLEQGKQYAPCPPETDGIKISNPLGAGFLRLAITLDQGEVGAQ